MKKLPTAQQWKILNQYKSFTLTREMSSSVSFIKILLN